MTKTESLSKMGSEIHFENIPDHIVDRVKYLALDFIGLAARGSIFDSSYPIHELIRKHGGTGNTTVIGKKDLRPLPQYAALANGSAAHSLEMDDTSNDASLHPAVATFSTALAVGEELGISGTSFIESAIFGYEVMVRVGKALNPTHHYNRGFHPTGTCGIFGAAATASKIMNLTVEETTNAFGIVGSQAAGSMEFLESGAWTKRLHPGWASHSGMIAVELAKNGFMGPSTIMEGEKGFARAYSYDFDLSCLDKPFVYDDELAVLRVSIKAHACCRYKQGPLDMILNIVKTHDLQPNEIEKINVYLVETALPIISVPEEAKRNPKTPVDAQFSMPFGAAVAVLNRNTMLEEYSQEVVDAEEVKEMMKKVYCYHDSNLDKEFPKKWPSRVEIISTKGTYSEEIEFPKGDPENPLTWEEMIQKFKYVTNPVYSESEQEAIIASVRNLEKIDDIRELTRLL